MKKITVEYESKEDMQNDVDLQAKGLAFEAFDEELRQLLKYGDTSEIYNKIMAEHRSDHDNYYGSDKYKAPTKKEFVDLMIYWVREKMSSHIDSI